MKTYPLFKVHVDTQSALNHIDKVFNSGYVNEGMQVAELTSALQGRLVTENLSLTNSCTSAITMALKLAGVGPGDEVISTAMTCVATNAPIVNLGANIVWADVDPESGMLDPRDVSRKINHKTKAVIAVAWAGTPPDMHGLDFVRRAGVKLIVDAAHAFDARYASKPLHEWADYTCYSFQAIKHFTTGDGGALVCSSGTDHKRAKSLKWFGLDRDIAKDERGDWKGQQWDVDIKEVGYKFNMNNVAAAIGLSQLPHIEKIIGGHRRNGALYDDLFKRSEVIRPAKRPDSAESSFWAYTVRLHPWKSKLGRDDMLKALSHEGIMAGVIHVPNDDYTCFDQFRVPSLPGLRHFSATQFSLPCGWWLSEDDIRYIAKRVMEIAG